MPDMVTTYLRLLTHCFSSPPCAHVHHICARILSCQEHLKDASMNACAAIYDCPSMHHMA